MIAAPRAATYAVLTLNGLAFLALMAMSGGSTQFSPSLLLKAGAISQTTLVQHEYWRLVACAFLHGGVMHILTNMICLVSWGGLVEDRVGATYFMMIYLVAAIGGSISSVLGHHEPFFSIGASGAVSGLVGALLGLAMLRKFPFDPQFFLVNIGLNVVLVSQVPGIDWIAHLGGLTAGLAAVAVIDQMEHANGYWLQCKFPEFVKFNLAVVLAAAAAALVEFPSYAALAGFAAVSLGLIKLSDIALAQNKGLATAIGLLAALNAALPLIFSQLAIQTVGRACRGSELAQIWNAAPWLRGAINGACSGPGWIPFVLAALAAAMTLLILSGELKRGLKDVGFVAITLRAERKRRSGI